MRFRATLLLAGKTATGSEVPPSVVEALGAGKRPPVTVTIGGYTYAAALDAAPAARQFFDGLSYSARSGFVQSIEAATTAETRQRRITNAVTSLREGRRT